MNTLKTAYWAILAQMAAVSTGLVLTGSTAETTVIVAGGIGVASCEIALRLFGRGNGGSGGAAVQVIPAS